jgi:[acyl-carrier-protein] S-malonyltransferase
MTHFAFLFPGQGSQSVGMLSDLSARFPSVKKTFDTASSILGYDLWDLTQQGPAEKLDQTEFTQPALLAADVAVWECWQSINQQKPQFFAGHSLGEYAALVCAESIAFEDAVSLVSYRGKYMQSAVPENTGAMAAIVGLEDDAVATVCDQASDIGLVSPANFNSLGQVVIAGEVLAVEKAIELAKTAGAKIAKKIPVSVPSHCALMQPAADQMTQKLAYIDIKKPVVPVIQNADVAYFETAQAIRAALVKQLISPVRWVETIQYMMKNDCHLFFECGPGKVLSGLNKRISRDINTDCVLDQLLV